jgi:hypothetical protein
VFEGSQFKTKQHQQQQKKPMVKKQEENLEKVMPQRPSMKSMSLPV